MSIRPSEVKTLHKLSTALDGKLSPSDLEVGGKRDARHVFIRCRYLERRGFVTWGGMRGNGWPGQYVQITEEGREFLEEFIRETEIPLASTRRKWRVSL